MIGFKKGAKLYSILRNKCPRCHAGDFWPNLPLKNLFLNKGDLNQNCSCCGLKYEIELGFWYGAMYVSYALGVALILLIWLLQIILFPSVDVLNLVFFTMISVVVFSPYNFFYSRLIWINFFVGYQPLNEA